MKQEKFNQPNIFIFGNKIDQEKEYEKERSCSKNEGDIFWGLLVVFFGLIFLGSAFGAITSNYWESIYSFWPLLIVLLGINIIIGKGFLQNILMFLLTVLVLGYVAIYGIIETRSPCLDMIPFEVIEKVIIINQFNK